MLAVFILDYSMWSFLKTGFRFIRTGLYGFKVDRNKLKSNKIIFKLSYSTASLQNQIDFSVEVLLCTAEI